MMMTCVHVSAHSQGTSSERGSEAVDAKLFAPKDTAPHDVTTATSGTVFIGIGTRYNGF